jgi:hypothetical protein
MSVGQGTPRSGAVSSCPIMSFTKEKDLTFFLNEPKKCDVSRRVIGF